jgi:phosphoribosyl 1,2-cyclic phosphodiesterase
MFRIKFWGVRGSIPTPGPATVKIGGNTSCVEIRCGKKLIVFDGGTGLRVLGDSLTDRGPIAASMFFSHVHWDHIQGFPFFKPAFKSTNHFDIYGGSGLSATLAETLAGQMNFPNFPVTLEQMAATMVFHQFDEGQIVNLGDGIEVKALSMNHPNGAYGYRVSFDGRSCAYCTDTEHRKEPDKNVIDLARGADVFIYDAQFTPEEYTGDAKGPPKIGWGHSTFAEGARLAKMAAAANLVLFHHDPAQDDEAVLEKERRCRELFPATQAAWEGLAIEL